MAASPVLRRYRALSRVPLGGRAFDLAVAAFAPFNAVLGVHVEALEPGVARTAMRDRAFRRNHLGTVHAVALAGLAETTGNLAVASLLGPGESFVVRRFAIEYEKKARGALRGECRIDADALEPGQDVEVAVELSDERGERVARATSVVRVRARRS